jgi:hypothetical protein
MVFFKNLKTASGRDCEYAWSKRLDCFVHLMSKNFMVWYIICQRKKLHTSNFFCNFWLAQLSLKILGADFNKWG